MIFADVAVLSDGTLFVEGEPYDHSFRDVVQCPEFNVSWFALKAFESAVYYSDTAAVLDTYDAERAEFRFADYDGIGRIKFFERSRLVDWQATLAFYRGAGYV